jgi:predicted dehydrogenase
MRSSRRSFLAGAAAVSAAGSLGLASCASRAPRPPRDPAGKARLLVIGVANRGADNLAGVASEDLRYLCDIDRQALAAAGQKFPSAKLVEDFRSVLGDAALCRELDGVVVSTPDHTHYPAAMMALQQGLDVYCEKPLTHTIAQARRLRAAARANGCITQMGIQIHANENYRRVVEAIGAGAVGTVREVIVWCGTNWSASELPKPSEVPAHVAWDLWLGPAAERPYADGYHPMGWRRYWAFGGGSTADMGCHFLDLAFWALQLDAPTSLQADGPEPHAECGPAALRCEYAFPQRGARAPVTLRWHSAGDRPNEALAQRGLEKWGNGVLFVGDDGWLVSDYSKHAVGPEARKAAWKAPAPSIAKSPGHHREWLDGSSKRAQPSCSFEYAVPLTETVLLANVAFRAARGRKLAWDAAAMRTDDAGANALLDVAARDGWRV